MHNLEQKQVIELFKRNKIASLPGLRLPHLKDGQEMQTVSMPVPACVRIPMLQHMGHACEPLVQAGDTVCVGQKIGDSDALMSVPVHASVSGTVRTVETRTAYSGQHVQHVVIDTDGTQTLEHPDMPVDTPDRDSFLNAVRESGLCGLGGAGFPTHVKLGYRDFDRLDTLIVNAAECEPYITSDYREMMEHPDQILEGILLVMKHLRISRAFIGIEDNKPQAITLLQEKTSAFSCIQIIPLRNRYPQGAEKMIAYAATGRVIPQGSLPADQGMIVMNVSSISFLAHYMKTSQPLTTRRITVSGDAVASPCNVIVPIGTSVADVLHYCGVNGDLRSVLMGGPMMGIAVAQLEDPIIKNNNALTILKHPSGRNTSHDTTACIRCSKCIRSCPMHLMPAMLEKAYDRRDFAAMPALGVDLCIGCGCCSYVCPAKRNLTQKIQLAKPHVRRYLEQQNAKEVQT